MNLDKTPEAKLPGELGGGGVSEKSESKIAEDRLKEALIFARELAQEEIQSIERIHGRTLQSFKYIGISVAAAGALIGFIGYVNLRNMAIRTAQNQMQAEVTKQVQEKLTKENIEGIVQDQVRNYSETKMQEAVHKALMVPAQSQMIRAAAADEARNQIKKQFAPRHFTKEQSDAFVKAVNDQPDLVGLPVEVMPSGFSIEASDYAKEISSSVALTKLKVVQNFPGFDASPIEGVAIYRDTASPEIPARRLQQAFLACGIDAKIVAAPSPPPNQLPAGEKVPLLIFVGVRF
ncbi:MAG: hypothetical protein ABR987_01250 [Terracidiphilus sp.]|jgi:hypothetical protein